MAFLARSSFQGHPGLFRFAGHFPGPISSRRPPRPIPIHRPLPRPNLVPKAIPAYPDSTAACWAHNTLNTPLPEPSREPFEPHREQVRRDRITRSRQV